MSINTNSKHARNSQYDWLTRIECFSYFLQRKLNVKSQCLFCHTSGLRNLVAIVYQHKKRVHKNLIVKSP